LDVLQLANPLAQRPRQPNLASGRNKTGARALNATRRPQPRPDQFGSESALGSHKDARTVCAAHAEKSYGFVDRCRCQAVRDWLGHRVGELPFAFIRVNQRFRQMFPLHVVGGIMEFAALCQLRFCRPNVL
jgi:hypothetical protein